MGGSKGGAPTPGPGSTTSSGTGSAQGNSAMMSNSTVTQSPQPDAMAAYEALLNRGEYYRANTANNDLYYQQAAPLNQTQDQALSMMDYYGKDAGAVGNQVYQYGQHTGDWNPDQVRAIESPYIQDVVGKTQDWFNNQNSIQGNSLLGQSIKSGNAFGGDRAGVGEAQLAGQQQIAQAPVIAGLYQSGYTQALDEYNRLKAFGIQGQQLGLAGKQFGIQGAEESLRAGNIRQEQQQRELDARTKEAVGANTYPMQMENWYASLVGGLGPLMGGTTNAATSGVSSTSNTSATSGITNPPAPNQLVQGLGLASAGVGLARGLFGGGGGKDGGPVGFKSGGDTGGNDSQSQDNSGDQTILVDPSQGGGSPIIFGAGGLRPARIPAPRVSPFPRLPNSPMPQAQAPIPSMSTPAAAAPSSGGNSWMDTLGAGIGLAAKAAPLFLREGGRVPGLVPRMQDGGDFYAADEEAAMGSPIGLPEDQPEAHSLINMVPDAPATGSPPGMPSFSMAPEDAPATGSPAGPPEMQPDASSIRVPSSAAGLGPPGAMAGGYGGGRGGGRGVTQYPGLGPTAPTMAQRMATDPFLAAGIAMLRSRSPYLGAGIGEGLAGAQHAMAGRAQQERLDNKPQMITHGETVQFRVGDKVIDTGIRTQAAMRAQEHRDLQSERLGATADQKERDRLNRKQIADDRLQARGKAERDRIDERAQKLQAEDPSMSYEDALRRAQAAYKSDELQWENRAATSQKNDPEGRPLDFWRNYYGLSPQPRGPGGKRAPAPASEPQPPATAPVTPGTKPPGVPEVRAPQAAPDLGAALRSGQTNQAEVLAQARAKIAREPGTRTAVIARLQQHGIDVSSLSETAPAIPMSQ